MHWSYVFLALTHRCILEYVTIHCCQGFIYFVRRAWSTHMWPHTLFIPFTCNQNCWNAPALLISCCVRDGTILNTISTYFIFLCMCYISYFLWLLGFALFCFLSTTQSFALYILSIWALKLCYITVMTIVILKRMPVISRSPVIVYCTLLLCPKPLYFNRTLKPC